MHSHRLVPAARSSGGPAGCVAALPAAAPPAPTPLAPLRDRSAPPLPPPAQPCLPALNPPLPAPNPPARGPQNKQSDLAWRLYTRLDAAGSASLAKPEYTAFLHAVGSIGVAPLAARAGAGSRRRARLTPDPGPSR